MSTSYSKKKQSIACEDFEVCSTLVRTTQLSPVLVKIDLLGLLFAEDASFVALLDDDKVFQQVSKHLLVLTGMDCVFGHLLLQQQRSFK